MITSHPNRNSKWLSSLVCHGFSSLIFCYLGGSWFCGISSFIPSYFSLLVSKKKRERMQNPCLDYLWPPHRKLKKRTTRAILFTSCYVHVHSSISSVYARSLVERRRILYKDIIWASLRLFLSSRRSFSIVLYTERPHHRGGGMCVWETEAGNREGLPEHLMDEWL